MEITYKKISNSKLFKDFENKDLLNMSKLSKLYSII